MIAKNETKTLPKCMASLKDFTDRGGEVILCDTGSTDGTADLARSLGCTVTEVGEKFITMIPPKTAKKINDKFIVDDEELIIHDNSRLFDFAEARNYATSLATNNMICTLDADEAYSTFNIDKINDLIDKGYEQFEYQFVYAHRPDGSPAIQFVQSKFFDCRKVKWTGIVHEVLSGEAKRMLLGQDVILLEHWQLPQGDHRSNYLVGLALDCYQNPDKDRQSHYFARELMWNGHPKSALKEFERHITMGGWVAEKAQSMIFMGDCYGMLNKPDLQVEWYLKAFTLDSNRREALIKLARFYLYNKNYKNVIIYAKSALEIPWSDYYANDKGMYEQEPHFLLYTAYGWLGDIASAQKHILIALDYQRHNPDFLRDTQFYFDYPANNITGWMSYKEQLFLYNTAKLMDSVVELGSWKGKSTHAICSSGCPNVTAIDHWEGSLAEPDAHEQAKDGSVFKEFTENTKEFDNLIIFEKDINEAVKNFPDKSADMIFIDAGHTYEEVKNDIRKWKSKAKVVLCGHDYMSIWPGVMQAVDEELGGPDEIHDTIWVKWLNKPKVSICIPTLGRPEKLHRLIEAIKENAGYDNYEIIVQADEPIPNNIGAPKTLKKAVERSTGELVMFLGNDCIPQKDFLKLALIKMAHEFDDLDGLVGLNDGYWKVGEIYTHWLASKKLLPMLDGEFFHTGYRHCGCDNELMERCRKVGKAVWAKDAKIFHDHPVQTGFKEPIDDIYNYAYKKENMEHDRDLLHKRAELLGFELHENFTRPNQ